MAVLTEKQVLAIRKKKLKGDYPKSGLQIRLAKKYGVSNKLISLIKLGKRWKHL